MYTVIAFDISCPRRRYRAVKVLLEHGSRVQRSVFEVSALEAAAFLRLRSKCEGLIDLETDSLRYYRLCAACAQRIEQVGVGPRLLVAKDAFEILTSEPKR